jgi:hypothetical protein
MESLHDLLQGRTPSEPEEFVALKHYITREFDAESNISWQGETLVITVHSASLANALRLRLPALRAAANTDKRIAFRIG